MRGSFVPIVLLAFAAPAAAQGPHVGAVRGLYEMGKRNVVAAAEQMPEEHFAFKPTPEVRSFGQIIGHVANANYMICSTITGAQNPSSANFEQTTSKAALVEALKESFAFCDQGAYMMTDEKAMEPLSMFGMDMTRMGALTLNTTHGWEHYGNLVTYMRIKGLVPPSSQGN